MGKSNYNSCINLGIPGDGAENTSKMIDMGNEWGIVPDVTSDTRVEIPQVKLTVESSKYQDYYKNSRTTSIIDPSNRSVPKLIFPKNVEYTNNALGSTLIDDERKTDREPIISSPDLTNQLVQRETATV